MSHRRLFGTPALVALGAALGVVAPQAARADEGPYPHLVHAMYEMREAKNELKEERFSRARERTIRDLEAAIDEVESALKGAKIEWKYDGPDKPKEYYKEYKDFPHLRHAVRELREARKELEGEKKHDWGGPARPGAQGRRCRHRPAGGHTEGLEATPPAGRGPESPPPAAGAHAADFPLFRELPCLPFITSAPPAPRA